MNCKIDEQLQTIGITPQFDQDSMLEFTLQKSDGSEITITTNKDIGEMKLRISAQSSIKITNDVAMEIFLDFAREAIEPLRDGYGVGIYPDSNQITIYKVLDMRDDLDLHLILENLLLRIEHWDRLLLAQNKSEPLPITESTAKTVTNSFCQFV